MISADPMPESGSTPDIKVVRLEGDIDIANAAHLGDWLCDLVTSDYEAVVVTCDAVTFVESRGLAMMARVQRRADDAGCRLTWRALPLHVLRTIHLTGLDAYLRIEA
jgi:anti-anti-sigma factor